MEDLGIKLILFIIVLIILWRLKANTEKQKDRGKTSSNSKNAASKNPPPSPYKSQKHREKTVSKNLLEDKENDWLANQLKEEHKAFKSTSDMFDLKIEHVSHCDAAYLEQFHHSHCDAHKVDDGTEKK